MNFSASGYRDELIENFFGNAEPRYIDRRYGGAPTRDEIRKCIYDTEFTRKAARPSMTQAAFDFDKWEENELRRNIYNNVTVRGLSCIQAPIIFLASKLS